jgi:hypothetical protein
MNTKTYIDFNDAVILFEGVYIPKNPNNADYARFLQEQQKGEAELVPYVPPAPTWEQIRAQRDNLLVQSDWIGVSDAQPKPNKEAWLNYRQALRDITSTYSSPEAVIWPQKPIA